MNELIKFAFDCEWIESNGINIVLHLKVACVSYLCIRITWASSPCCRRLSSLNLTWSIMCYSLCLMKTHFNLLRILITFLWNLHFHSISIEHCLFQRFHSPPSWIFTCFITFSFDFKSVLSLFFTQISLHVNCDNLLITQSIFFTDI